MQTANAKTERLSLAAPPRLLLSALPWLGPRGKALVLYLGDRAPDRVTASEVCRSLGFRSRFVLSRLLISDGLPPLVEFYGWVRVLWHCQRAEAECVTLGGHELRHGRDPAIVYRLVRRVTGRTWREVQSLGSGWVFAELVAHCRPPAVRCPLPSPSPAKERRSA